MIIFTRTIPCHLLLDERFSTLQRYKESIKQSRLYLELLIKFIRFVAVILYTIALL